ncbi:MAG: nitrous oxide reductase family maturation protein NosD [Salinivenus sp.]
MRTLFWILTCGLLLGAGPNAGGGQSLQARIDRAAPGDTLVVEGGVHNGPLVVDTSLVLVGQNRPHLRGDEETHVVIVSASDVTIEGFRITDSGKDLNQDHAGVMVEASRVTLRDNHLSDVLHGVYVKGGNRAVLTENRVDGPPTVTRRVSPADAVSHGCSVSPTGGDCEVPLPLAQRGNGIHLWNSLHSTITHNTVRHTRDGIYFSHSDHAYAAHNTIHDVRYGLHYMYSDDNTFEQNAFSDNASGSALMYSEALTVRDNVFRNNRSQRGYGLLLQSVEGSRFANNRLIQNGTGVYLENSTGNAFAENEVASNYRGLRFTGSSMDNRFGRNLIRGNLNTATVSGASATNAWHLDGRGNYWGPRGLLDANADGVSELPHHTVDLFGERRSAFPYVDLLAGSPGLALLAEALGRVAGTGVPKITDSHALLQPPTPLKRAGGGGVVPLLALGLALLTVGWTVLRRHST